MRDSRFPTLLRTSSVWFAAFAFWACLLWILSDRPLPGANNIDLPGFDKILHFLYFLIGAALLSVALYLRGLSSWCRNLSVVLITVAVIGALDEWHQSWIPGRSGNDLGDWIADLLGGVAGALITKSFHSLRKALR